MSHGTTLDMRTVPGPVTGTGACESPLPDWADCARDTTHTLPEGTQLRDYEIVGPIGEGGFGIVYLAWDRLLEQHVAIKEYLPAVLASRASVSPAVIVKSRRHQDSFQDGLRCFVNEARILARFDHPSLVRVLSFWEGNGTAYMAMPYYVGPTLARALAELGRPPTEAELRRWLRPLLDALGILHAVSCFHRDIAPDNILLTDDGPVLLDFGAARHVIEGSGKSPTVVFKPGFAPIEQCGEGASMKQGAWTDLYALASVVYMAITGQPPAPSIERLMGAPLRPLAELARGRYSAPFLAAIDAAMALHPCNRTQSVAEFWTQLSAEPAMMATAAPRARAPSALPAATVAPVASRAPVAQWRSSRTKVFSLAATALLMGLAAAGYHRMGDPVTKAVPQASLAAVSATPAPVTPAPVAFAPAMSAPATPAPLPGPIASLPPAPLDDAPDLAMFIQPQPLPRLATVPEAIEPAPAPIRKAVVRPLAEPARATRREARAAPAELAQGQGSSRCTDILQRASLETLTSGEAASLRKGCE